MKTILAADLERDPTQYQAIAEILRDDGLVIFPGNGAYRLGVNVRSSAAVNKMLQAKRRVQHAPALVFVGDREMLADLVTDVPQVAGQLMGAFWPGPLTIRFEPGEGLPAKVRRALSKATGTIGFRVPGNEYAAKMIAAFGGPILVSSANRSKRHGAQSLAQVRKSFGRVADLLIDAGDLAPGQSSTIVDVKQDQVKMVREAAVSEQEIAAQLQ